MECVSFEHSANKLEALLGKDAREFTKEDIVQVVDKLGIEMLNFMFLLETED